MTPPPAETAILRVLRRSSEPLSGRQVAEIVGLAPNTAIKHLKYLQAQGQVSADRSGRATLWTTTADVGLLEGTGPAVQTRVALVVTAVELEFAAVRQRLVNAERVRSGARWFVRGEVLGPGVSWTVYLAQAGKGNATSAALVAHAAGDLQANVVAFVGTAGGLKPADHRHGDVVVASRIHNPYTGKQVAAVEGSQLLGRDTTYTVPAPLLQLAMAAIADSEWSPSSTAPAYNSRHPHGYIAPIVAVEAVQTDVNGPLLDEVGRRYQDAAALDMESYGLAAGSDIHDLPVLVVRGISDFIEDKVVPGNDAVQPTAAGNAAALLVHLLGFAHPDDFRRVAGQPAPPAPIDSSPGTDSRDSVEAKLPGGAKMWLRRLRRRSPERALAALDAIVLLRGSEATAATWLNKAVHRPPAWLREDDTGDGWMLMGSLAALAGSRVSWRAFDLAADAAKLTGDLGAQIYFKLTAALHQIGEDEGDADRVDDAGRARARDNLEMFPPDLATTAEPLLLFYRSLLSGEPPEVKSSAGVVLGWLGLADESGVLQLAQTDEPHPFDNELRDTVASTVLQPVARLMLTPGAADDFGVASGLAVRQGRGNPVLRDLADDALVLGQWASGLRPESEGARLVEVQCLLAVLIALTGRSRAEVDHEVASSAKRAETTALEVREVFREWHGSSGAALAAAARARSMQGDVDGALRMLLPVPDGVATQAEARHPEVARLAAFFASATGQHGLALNLAADNIDAVEAELLKASVLGSRVATSAEATEALMNALLLSNGRLPERFRALMALARSFEQLSEVQQAVVLGNIDDTEVTDAELAEVLRARVALSVGDAVRALQLVRALPASELVLMTRTDALVALGRVEEACRDLAAEGNHRRDAQLLLAAMGLALKHDARELAREISQTILTGVYSDGAKLQALEALRHVERLDERWSRVVELTKQLIDRYQSRGRPVLESEQWLLVEALYFQERFRQALEVLTSSPTLSFGQRERVLLFFSVLKRAQDDGRASGRRSAVVDLGGTDLFSRFMEAARQWSHDEQLASFALNITMLAPDAELSQAQVLDVREFAERYFDSHGERASIQKIAVGDDLEELVDLLSKSDLRSQKLDEVAELVRSNAAPLAVLTAIAGRSYAESLIRVDLGYLIAVEDDGGVGVATAKRALDGRAIADTSALVVAPLTGVPLRKLVAKFDSVVLPDPLRRDVERARSSLALRSTGTLGWDPRTKQPFVRDLPESEAEKYAQAADELREHARLLNRSEGPRGESTDDWMSAINLARSRGWPLWADDVALRQLARSVGVAAFGSLDVITAYAEESAVEAAVASLRTHRVVDLPLGHTWHASAVDCGWDPGSSFGAAIARPYQWRDVEGALTQFRLMIRLRDLSMEPAVLGGWAHAAATGLALATPAPNRHRAVSELVAWVLLATDPYFSPDSNAEAGAGHTDMAVGKPGEVAQALFAVADSLRLRYYPDAELIKPLVEVLGNVLRQTVGPAPASQTMAGFAALLGQPLGPLVFAAYLRSA